MSDMRNILVWLLMCLGVISAAAARDSRAMNFDKGWRFTLENPAEAYDPNQDDTSWRSLDLPHDWAIEGNFSEDNPSGTGGGALPGGIGWYRKTFTFTPSMKGKQVYIDFDGVYMNSTIYINGHELGTRPYGYASFGYDLTPWLRPGKNVVAVRVDNSEQPNSRWYSGCGIYRHVWLRILDPVHVAKWGTFVRQDKVTKQSADLAVITNVENNGKKSAKATLVTTVYSPENAVVATVSTPLLLQPGIRSEVEQNLSVADPDFWEL